MPKITARRVLIALAFAAVLAGGYVLSKRGPKIEYDTVGVRHDVLRQTVEVTGEVVSSADVDLKFEAAGRVRSIEVKVGMRVETGDALASLDDRNERVRVQSAQAALLSAQANLERLLNGTTAEDLRVSEVAVENAEIALGQARQALDDAKISGDASVAKTYGDLEGAIDSLYLKASAAMQTLRNDVYDAAGNLRSDISPSDFALQTQSASAFSAAKNAIVMMDADIAAFRATDDRAALDAYAAALIASGRVVREAAQLANAMMQASAPAGGTSQASFDTRKSNVKLAWTDLNAAVAAAESQKLLVASTTASAVSTANAAAQAVRVSEGSLESAKAALAFKKAPATSYDLASARASVSQASATLGEANLALDRMRIRAPFDGMIAAVLGRTGSTVTAGDVIMKLHGDDVFEIEADVPETDVAKLRTGMKASMTLDAYGDDVVFDGELVSIDTAETVIQDVVYYKTRFRFISAEREIRAGMTAAVTVVALERNSALIVPQRSIREDEDGKKYVRVLEKAAEVRRDVVIGVRGDDGLVEILSGLSGGEQVILSIRENGQVKR